MDCNPASLSNLALCLCDVGLHELQYRPGECRVLTLSVVCPDLPGVCVRVRLPCCSCLVLFRSWPEVARFSLSPAQPRRGVYDRVESRADARVHAGAHVLCISDGMYAEAVCLDLCSAVSTAASAILMYFRASIASVHSGSAAVCDSFCYSFVVL